MTFQMYFGAGNTTVSTTLLVCFTASFQIPSTALATSPFAARAEVLQKCSQEQQRQQPAQESSPTVAFQEFHAGASPQTLRNLRMDSRLPTTPTAKPVSA